MTNYVKTALIRTARLIGSVVVAFLSMLPYFCALSPNQPGVPGIVLEAFICHAMLFWFWFGWALTEDEK
jgi:hypothetical protein